MNNLAPDMIDRVANAFAKVAEIFDMANSPDVMFGFFDIPLKLLLIILASVPVIIWMYIFFRHKRENIFLAISIFLAGMLAVIPIFVFQHEIARIGGILENLFANVVLVALLTSLWVGFYEETSKSWIMKISSKSFIRNIDDAIIFSIIVALGFAFIENVLYFVKIWNDPAIDESIRWFYVVFRSIGSMFLHILASGIFGYYHGIAHFAKPVLQDQLASGKHFIFTKWIHQILHLKSETVFREEKIFEGLLIAASLHATFDFFMSMSQHFTDIDSEIFAKIFLLASVPFLVGGFFWLTYLLDKKEDHKDYGGLEEKDVLD
jgi:RsiW-degrading membrane proteinase PrsW (M82 family)